MTDTRPLSLAARAGFAGKATFHLVLGLLVVQLAIGSATEQASQQGAIDALARQPFGRTLLALLAIGLAGYAVFRAWRAIAPSRHADTSLPAWVHQVASGLRAIAYGALAGLAAQNVLTGRSSGGGGEARTTGRLLAAPGGVVAVVAIGAVVLAVGLRFARTAVTGDPLASCDLSHVGAARRRAYVVVARLGLLGRSLAYLLVGVFLVRAALRFDASEGVGLDGALHEVARSTVGGALVVAVGAGLVLFAAHVAVVATHGVVERIE